VVLYLALGGLRAKFLADWVHVVVMFIILIIFIWTVYVKTLGTDLIWNGLQTVANYTPDQCRSAFFSAPSSFYSPGTYACGPVAGNSNGSFLTMLSSNGTIFGILQIFSNFGTIFVDQAYWQSAIAAQPQSGGRGFFWGALAAFSIPFALGSSLGLAATALQLPINSTEVSNGLVAPAMAYHLLGNSGIVLFGIMVFMAVTSGVSGEILALSSLFTYDIYKAYFRPHASGKDILFVSRAAVLFFGLSVGALACILNAFGCTAGWLYSLMGIIIGSSVIPLWNLVMWKDANGPGAVAGSWLGMAMAIGTWLLVAAGKYGTVSVATLGSVEAMLAGNIMALLSGGLIHGWLSLMAPQDYDFRSMNEIRLLEDDLRGLNPVDFEGPALTKNLLWTAKCASLMVLTLVILWPVWALPALVFDSSYFSFWIFISLAWGFAAAFFVTAVPLEEYALYQTVVAPFLFSVTRLVIFAPDEHFNEEFEVTMGEQDSQVDDMGVIIGMEADLDMKEAPPRRSGASRQRGFDPLSCLWFCPPRSPKSAGAVAARPY